MALARPALTPHPLRDVSAGAMLLIAGTTLGAVVTHEGAARTGELRLDQAMASDREAPLTAAAHAVDIGFGPGLAPIILLGLCLVVALRNRRAAVVLGVTTIAGWFSVAVGKILIGRQRPPTTQVHALVHEVGANSFPSGHTAFAAALLAGAVLAARVAGRSTRWIWSVGIPAGGLVAASRLYLGAHYLGDVIGSQFYVAGTVLLLAGVISHLMELRSVRAQR